MTVRDDGSTHLPPTEPHGVSPKAVRGPSPLHNVPLDQVGLPNTPADQYTEDQRTIRTLRRQLAGELARRKKAESELKSALDTTSPQAYDAWHAPAPVKKPAEDTVTGSVGADTAAPEAAEPTDAERPDAGCGSAIAEGASGDPRTAPVGGSRRSGSLTTTVRESLPPARREDGGIPLPWFVGGAVAGLLLGVIVGSFLSWGDSGAGSDGQAKSPDAAPVVALTEMQCQAGSFVAFIGAGMPPQGYVDVAKQYHDEVGRATKLGVDPATLHISDFPKLCAKSTENYTNGELPGKHFVWAGPFADQAAAESWCRSVGREDFKNNCVIRQAA